MRNLIVFAVLIGLLLITVRAVRPGLGPPPCPRTVNGFKFKDFGDQIPGGWDGHVFKLNADYPTTEPPRERHQWEDIKFDQDPIRYLNEVRDYVLDGNIDPAEPNKPFEIQNNKKRKWYHAPWLDVGPNGREFVNGLTRELTTPGLRYLSPSQKDYIQNWAVGFYNAPGGFTIGQVWCDPDNPQPQRIGKGFPPGTVAAKLLFSVPYKKNPIEQDIPFIKGTVKWKANVYVDPDKKTTERTVQDVYLLQMDVAVRDPQATDTGWVFGTYIYNRAHGDPNPWKNLEPVGLMWGDDPGVAAGDPIKQSWINPAIAKAGLMTHYGWGSDNPGPGRNRLNGPIDNKISSCLSCHSTAGWPEISLIPVAMPWFQNIQAGHPFVFKQDLSFDYSLQLEVGYRNFMAAKGTKTLTEILRLGESDELFKEQLENDLIRTKKMPNK